VFFVPVSRAIFVNLVVGIVDAQLGEAAHRIFPSFRRLPALWERIPLSLDTEGHRGI
jgi:hypothetical protein